MGIGNWQTVISNGQPTNYMARLAAIGERQWHVYYSLLRIMIGTYLIAIAAGIAGTALMTLFVYLQAFITKNRFPVIKILGTLLTSSTTPEKGLSNKPIAVFTGTIVHYLVGIFFSIVYVWLWRYGIGTPEAYSALLFGAVNGIVAALGWRLFIALHPNPPALPLRAFLLTIAAGHLVFALGVLLTNHLFS